MIMMVIFPGSGDGTKTGRVGWVHTLDRSEISARIERTLRGGQLRMIALCRDGSRLHSGGRHHTSTILLWNESPIR